MGDGYSELGGRDAAKHVSSLVSPMSNHEFETIDSQLKTYV